MLGNFSEITSAVDAAFLFVLVISVVLLALITVLMIGFAVKYHRSRNPVASQVHGNTLLEIVWTVIPTILALAMFYYGFIGYRLMKNPPPGALEVTGTARMWSWQFTYENGKRDGELVVPAGTPVKVNLEATDVLHSFYVPAFKVKQDCVPGMDTFVWFEGKEEGEYDIFCTEYCGARHSYMLSKVRVISDREFSEWVETDVEPIEVDESASEEERAALLIALGKRLSVEKGCNVCHSVDGSKLVGPTYKGSYGTTVNVTTDGALRGVVVDDEYIRNSIINPTADVHEGFPPVMPSQQGLVTDDEITALIAYIKSIK